MTRDPDCIPPVPTEEGGELKPSGWPDTRGPNWECPSCAESVCDHEPNCPHQIAVAAALQEEAGETLLSPAHQDTHRLLNRFSLALADKLARAEIKYGYGNGWLTDDWEAECRAQLHQHADKGDPLDVAAYAAFCWARGWSTSLPTQAPQDVAPCPFHGTTPDPCCPECPAPPITIRPYSMPRDTQDVAGLVEGLDSAVKEVEGARTNEAICFAYDGLLIVARQALSALRASPISHETSTSAENARVAQPPFEEAAADHHREALVEALAEPLAAWAEADAARCAAMDETAYLTRVVIQAMSEARQALATAQPSQQAASAAASTNNPPQEGKAS